jgi:hypothetical protein
MKRTLCLAVLALALPCSAGTNRLGEFVATATAARCASGFEFEPVQLFLRVETNRAALFHFARGGNIFESGTNTMRRTGVIRGTTAEGFRYTVKVRKNGTVGGTFSGVCGGFIEGERTSWSE